jgi:hypothetical protein
VHDHDQLQTLGRRHRFGHVQDYRRRQCQRHDRPDRHRRRRLGPAASRGNRDRIRGTTTGYSITTS